MSQVDSETVDIAIVGAGLVGASLAVRLGQSEVCKDLSIALIDANSPPAPLVSSQTSDFDPRVVALTHRSQLLLAELGVWSSLLASEGGHGPCPYTDMRVWDGEGTGKIHFHCSDVGAESLGYIVENNLLISRLNGRVAGLERLKSFWGRALTTLKMSGSGVKLAFGKAPSLRARLVVGADGANSQVRALGGFDTRQWQYGQRAIVTTIKTAKSHQFTAWQRFTRAGPLAFLPLCGPDGDTYHSAIVWSLDEDQADEIAELDDSAFALALERAFESTLGEVVWADRRHSFPLWQRHAKSYIKPQLALVGDAAHTIHPLAGQGVNLGLLDVVALAQEVERAVVRGIPLQDMSILRRYQRARLGPNLAMMALMEGFKRLFGSENAWLQLMRNTGMSGVGSSRLLRQALVRHATGI